MTDDGPQYYVHFPGDKPGCWTEVYAFSWHQLIFRVIQSAYYSWRYSD